MPSLTAKTKYWIYNVEILDITNLNPPDAIEAVDFEDILTERIAELLALMPDDRRDDVIATLKLESEPLTIALQTAAYREMVLIEKMNAKVRAIFLATATKADLEHHGFPWGLERKVIQEADQTATPPTPQVLETDSEYRRRIQMAPQKLSTAGPGGSYVAHALDFDASIKDAATTRPIPGTVRVHVLTRENNGQPPQQLLDGLWAYLDDEKIRPLSDTVETVAATAKAFDLIYQVEYLHRPEIEITKEQVALNIQQLMSDRQMLGKNISLVHLYGAIDVPGVASARVISPVADIVCEKHEYPFVSRVEERPL